MTMYFHCALAFTVLAFLSVSLARADEATSGPAGGAVFVAEEGGHAAATSLFKSGDKVAFLGDSITEAGWSNADGYVRVVVAGLKANGISIVPIPAGVSGNNSAQLLARLPKDVLDKKPDWVVVFCGVNDVAHATGSLPLAQYKANMTAIVDQAQAANIKVLLLTATVIGEDLTGAANKKLADYNACVRDLAQSKKAVLSDVNAAMQVALQAAQQGGKKPGGALTKPDGVHMIAKGDLLIATTILQTLGLTADELAKAQRAWQKLEGSSSTNSPTATTNPAPAETGHTGRHHGRHG